MRFEQEFAKYAKIKLSETVLTEEAQQKVLQYTSTVSIKTCPLYKLLHSRIVGIWKKRFLKQTVTHDELTRIGFGKYITQKIVRICDKFRSIFDVNIMVHGDLYNELIVKHVGQL